MNRLTLVKACVAPVIAAPVVVACAVMSARVGDDARFVTWPVVAFTALAGGVAIVGVLSGLSTPLLLAGGILPALLLSYVLPAGPLPVVGVVLVVLCVLAIRVGGVASGVAATTGALMVVFVVVQGPAVDCNDAGVSTNSGPWWVDEPSSSSGSGRASPEGTSVGVVQVGEHRYEYVCQRSRLVSWDRTTPDR